MAGQLGVNLRRLLGAHAAENDDDAHLLERFVAARDEAAFAALVERYGRLVLGVCRALLRHEEDAEDAFQATFLVLARMAASIRQRESLSSWLYGVAQRTALKARRAMATRRRHEPQAETRTPQQPVAEAALREVQAIFHEEVGRLAAKYRAPFVLCCLEGKSRAEAARQLGWKEGTVSGRIAQARAKLEGRLTRRGVALSAALGAVAAAGPSASAVPAALSARVVPAAVAFATERAVAGQAALLAEGVIGSMFSFKLKIAAGVALALAVVLGGATLLASAAWQPQAPEPSPAGDPPPLLAAARKKPKPAPGPAAEDALPPAALCRLGTKHFRQLGGQHAAYSPDGSILATGGMDIRLWDANTRRLLRVLPLPDRGIDGDVTQLRFTADGKTLYCQGSGSGQVSAFDVASGKRLFRFVPAMSLSAFDVTPDGAILATGGQQGQLILWKASTREQLRVLDEPAKGQEFYLQSVTFSPDGKWLAAMGASTTGVSIYEVASGDKKRILPIQGTYGGRLVFSPDGYLASYNGASSSGTTRLWDVSTGKIHKEYPWGAASAAGSYPLAFSPDGKWMAGDNGRGRLAVWDRATGRWRFTDPHSNRGYGGLAFSRDGNTLCAGTYELWDLNTGRSLIADGGHVVIIQALALTPDGKTAVTADGITVRFWDTRTGQETRRLEEHSVSSLALSGNGRILVMNLQGTRTIVLWDMAAGKELRRIAVKEDPVRVGISPDARTVAATASNNLTVRFFDAETGKETRVLVGNTVGSFGLDPLAFQFSPDGKYFASLVRSKERGLGIGLWNLSEKDARAPALHLEAGHVWDLAFSPDAEYLAWADQACTRVWDMRARKLLPIKGPPGRVVFTPDGRYLIAGAKLVPLDAKRAPLELPVYPGWIACSRDSNLLVVVPQSDCTALVLDARKLGK
jgi:RNA polymerase sigma factor (sigma-70 family)